MWRNARSNVGGLVWRGLLQVCIGYGLVCSPAVGAGVRRCCCGPASYHQSHHPMERGLAFRFFAIPLAGAPVASRCLPLAFWKGADCMGRKKDGGKGSRTSHVDAPLEAAVGANAVVYSRGEVIGGERYKGIELPLGARLPGIEAIDAEMLNVVGRVADSLNDPTVKGARFALKGKGEAELREMWKALPVEVRQAVWVYWHWEASRKRYKDLPLGMRYALSDIRRKLPIAGGVMVVAENLRREEMTRSAFERLEKYGEDEDPMVRASAVKATEALLDRVNGSGNGGRGGGITINVDKMLMVNGDDAGQSKLVRRMVGGED